MTPTIVSSLDEDTWRSFVDAHPHGNIFQTPEMFQVFARAKGHRPVLRAAANSRGEVMALMAPVEVTLHNGPLRRLSTRSIAYGSLLAGPRPTDLDALAILLRVYTEDVKRRALFTELRNLSDLSDLQAVLNQNGFIYDDHLDYLIDLNCSPDEVLQHIGPRTRKHIRQAVRKGHVIVEEITDPDKIAAWYGVVCKSYAAARVPLTDRSLFDAAFQILQPQGMVKFWLARLGRAYVAASAELVYKDVVYGWYGGIDRVYGDEMPGEVLMWHILEWGALAGYRTYDFGGAGKPGEAYGVRAFKAKFGGQLVCFGRNTKVHSPNLLSWSQRGYQVYRHLAGHVQARRSERSGAYAPV